MLIGVTLVHESFFLILIKYEIIIKLDSPDTISKPGVGFTSGIFVLDSASFESRDSEMWNDKFRYHSSSDPDPLIVKGMVKFSVAFPRYRNS